MSQSTLTAQVNGNAGGSATRRDGIDWLLDPAAFPHQITHLSVCETPISWIVLTGVYAYKIKKPVRYEFIDASTLARRRHLCEEELRLNRRFAPQLYVDVVPIAEEHGRARIGASGPPIEYAVRMQEFEHGQQLSEQIAANQVTHAELAAFGRSLAALHRAAPVTDDPLYGNPQLVRSQLLENFSALERRLGGGVQRAQLDRLRAWSLRSLDSHTALLRERARRGAVRECHGDLHGGNIVRYHGRWQAFDCLEFEPRLRWIDVMSDVAFLFMDLGSRHRADLAYAFLSAYLEDSGDYAGLPLLGLFAVYRALVRAKVDALAIDAADAVALPGLEDRLLARLNVAAALAGAPAPALLLMHGASASGKSWLSGELVSELGAVRVRSDLERHRLRGAAGPDYSEAAVRRIYSHLLECAENALAGGCRTIVDATFLEPAERERFRTLAARHAAPCLVVSCRATPECLEQRLARRAMGGLDASEATVAVLQSQLARLSNLTPEEHAATIEVDTESATAVTDAAQAINARLNLPVPAPPRAAASRPPHRDSG